MSELSESEREGLILIGRWIENRSDRPNLTRLNPPLQSGQINSIPCLPSQQQSKTHTMTLFDLHMVGNAHFCPLESPERF